MKTCCTIQVDEDSLVIDLPEEGTTLDSLLGDIESCGGSEEPWLQLIDKVMGNSSETILTGQLTDGGEMKEDQMITGSQAAAKGQ
ncbi:hypothetical protein C1I60_23755 [Paenibacillus terrae]|uniref:Uncharacterized protein n=1 Tax=Paenibacillus terrae TaxID=159743 RepID=A0A4U2PV71_9BACL|nr:hypothetical protein [Paenibacillus terrae]TKH40788.1 hypothetical protein C1I60_23755 [Paenibacillus terrae]